MQSGVIQDRGPRVSVIPRQGLRPNTGHKSDIRVDVPLTLIPVTVTDSRGATYAGLARDDFRLLQY